MLNSRIGHSIKSLSENTIYSKRYALSPVPHAYTSQVLDYLLLQVTTR